MGMKKIITPATVLLLVTSIVFLTGCARSVKRPTPEAVNAYLRITNTEGPIPISGATNNKNFKMGRAKTSGILYLVAWGDSSIKEAMSNGNITKLHHVDYEYSNFGCLLPFFESYTVIVYGE